MAKGGVALPCSVVADECVDRWMLPLAVGLATCFRSLPLLSNLFIKLRSQTGLVFRQFGQLWLNLAQDAVLGWHAPLKSPAGTTEKVIETWSWIRGFEMEVPGIASGEGVTCSRPYGTFRLSNLYPGLRSGLSSAVPAGLILQSVGSHAESLGPEVRFFISFLPKSSFFRSLFSH
jgi:hypothetical protein